MRCRSAAWGLLIFCVACAGQDVENFGALADRAVKEFRADDWPAAERDFREVVKRDPSNVFAHMYLDQTLFRQEKYADAATFFQKTRDLQRSGKQLNTTQDRILTDQLVMSYGITGQMKKAHALLDEAVGKDPGYPLNYYNRACAFAEEGDKSKALTTSTLRFSVKPTFCKESRCLTREPILRSRSMCTTLIS